MNNEKYKEDFENWWRFRSIGIARDTNYPMMEISYIAGRTQSEQENAKMRELLIQARPYLKEHFFAYGKSNEVIKQWIKQYNELINEEV